MSLYLSDIYSGSSRINWLCMHCSKSYLSVASNLRQPLRNIPKSPSTLFSGITAPFLILSINCRLLLGLPNGCRPKYNSYIITPIENMSILWDVLVYSSLHNISGAEYKGVPAIDMVIASSALNASPKSVSLMLNESFSKKSNSMFSGLMSRCIILFSYSLT